jgi:hypothetical protein
LSGRRDTGRQEFASGVSVVAKTGDDQPQNSLEARSKSPPSSLALIVGAVVAAAGNEASN